MVWSCVSPAKQTARRRSKLEYSKNVSHTRIAGPRVRVTIAAERLGTASAGERPKMDHRTLAAKVLLAVAVGKGAGVVCLLDKTCIVIT